MKRFVPIPMGTRSSMSLTRPFSDKAAVITPRPVVGAPLRPKVTPQTLLKLRGEGKPFTMVTAYSAPAAAHIEAAGAECILVGDSVAMVEMGHDTTLSVTVDEMLHHCKAVARGALKPLLVGDLPFGSYEISPQEAFKTASRFLKEAGMDAVKMEGASAPRIEAVRLMTLSGVAVMGHIGLTPQHISVLGGFRAQGKTSESAKQLIEQALALQDAGAFSLVIECVPAEVAQAVTEAVDIPTIGIGAGPHTSGQVLVFHDLIGWTTHPHYARVAPRFVKQYAQVGQVVQEGLKQFVDEVSHRKFPGDQYSPYKLDAGEKDKFLAQKDDMIKQARSRSSTVLDKAARKTDASDETIKVY